MWKVCEDGCSFVIRQIFFSCWSNMRGNRILKCLVVLCWNTELSCILRAAEHWIVAAEAVEQKACSYGQHHLICVFSCSSFLIYLQYSFCVIAFAWRVGLICFSCLKFISAIGENFSLPLNCRFFDQCFVGTACLKRSFFTLFRKISDPDREISCCRKNWDHSKSWRA